jgi:hypothetical protein
MSPSIPLGCTSRKRRDVLKAGLSTSLAPRLANAAPGEAVAIGLVLRETAGLRRFGSPVHLLPPGDLSGQAGDAPGLAGLGRPWVVRKGPDGNRARSPWRRAPTRRRPRDGHTSWTNPAALHGRAHDDTLPRRLRDCALIARVFSGAICSIFENSPTHA